MPGYFKPGFGGRGFEFVAERVVDLLVDALKAEDDQEGVVADVRHQSPTFTVSRGRVGRGGR